MVMFNFYLIILFAEPALIGQGTRGDTYKSARGGAVFVVIWGYYIYGAVKEFLFIQASQILAAVKAKVA